MEATQQVIFKLGEEEYGFDIMLVNAIETFTGIIPVPNSSEHILGIVNLRGDVIPVFSLRKKFGMPEVDLETSQLIVTRSNGVMVGFKVDAVKEIVGIEAQELSEMPRIVKNEKTTYAKCVANKGGQMIILLDHDGILNSEEQSAAQALINR
ncbi:MAG: chemotaxis protein CheW [Lachnospiraceae bacterium]|nr:chemotaxis protein CheW [Lachnospiraceae bacterium]